LTPLQDFVFLGYRFLLRLAKVFPTSERFQKILLIAAKFLRSQNLPARLWQRLLGLLAATERLVPQGLLHMRPIQLHLHHEWNQLSQLQSVPVFIPASVKTEIQWWMVPAHVLCGVPLRHPEPHFQLMTDASLHGWGAHLQDHTQTVSGVWTERESCLHINLLGVSGRVVSSPTFSTASSRVGGSCGYRQHHRRGIYQSPGGTTSPSLCNLAYDILTWAQSHHIQLRARHIPGSLNVLADLLSRQHQVIPTEWALDAKVFTVIGRL
jgi:hypothetical protein